MASAAAGGCLVGCLGGVGASFGTVKWRQCSKSCAPDAEGFSSPRFPFSSPGPGWQKFQSPAEKQKIVDASKNSTLHLSSLTAEKADFGKLGSMCLELAEDAYIDVLTKLIDVSKYLQNNPRLNITPEEKKACIICMDELRPYSKENGGPLIVEELEYVKGRPSLKVTYPGASSKTVSFVGCHFDVVPANPEDWNVDPFKLTRVGDKLHGRGTTDCLGHVALLTRLMCELGKTQPRLKNTIIAVFIAAEEGGETGVGVDMVVKNGKMESSKNGPVYWVDSADSNPCCGTSGTMSWSLTAKGRVFHSGFPHKGINSIELVSDAVAQIQERFYDDFPPRDEELKYQFAAGSNMKPTQMECKKGGLNQICAEATMHGDIRLSPFYDVADVQKAIEMYVQEMNEGIDLMPTRGPYSKYKLEDDVETQPGELRQGSLEIKWSGDIETFRSYEGIACSLDSQGHKALVQACRETYGTTKPFSVNGSLPLVRQMQKAGFDLQLIGFGLMKVYHGVDEYCTLSGMANAYLILLRVIALLEATA